MRHMKYLTQSIAFVDPWLLDLADETRPEHVQVPVHQAATSPPFIRLHRTSAMQINPCLRSTSVCSVPLGQYLTARLIKRSLLCLQLEAPTIAELLILVLYCVTFLL
jgi:hypothetical protein